MYCFLLTRTILLCIQTITAQYYNWTLLYYYIYSVIMYLVSINYYYYPDMCFKIALLYEGLGKLKWFFPCVCRAMKIKIVFC